MATEQACKSQCFVIQQLMGEEVWSLRFGVDNAGASHNGHGYRRQSRGSHRDSLSRITSQLHIKVNGLVVYISSFMSQPYSRLSWRRFIVNPSHYAYIPPTPGRRVEKVRVSKSSFTATNLGSALLLEHGLILLPQLLVDLGSL